MPLKPHQRSFVSKDGESCGGTAFFCAGAGLPDSRPRRSRAPALHGFCGSGAPRLPTKERSPSSRYPSLPHQASRPIQPHQRRLVSEDGVSCEGTAFFCAGAGVPDSRDPGTSLHTTPTNRRRSSANLARSLGPTPRILARSRRLSGHAVTMSRSTASRTTRKGGTPISRATPARHAVMAASRGSSSGACFASSPDARVTKSREASARRMVPPSRAASAGPTPGTSASDAASAGG